MTGTYKKIKYETMDYHVTHKWVDVLAGNKTQLTESWIETKQEKSTSDLKHEGRETTSTSWNALQPHGALS